MEPEPEPARESVTLDTALGHVRVRIGGSGQPIMFWPSLLMNGDMWLAQARYFGPDHRVILVDSPGHGESQRLTAPFTFEECTQCIVDVLDGLGIERTHFVGNSWGGMIGGTFAATHPDRVGRAVLMNATASPAGTRQKLEYGALLRMAKLIGGIRPPLTRSVLKAFLGPTSCDVRCSPSTSTPARGRCAAWCAPPGPARPVRRARRCRAPRGAGGPTADQPTGGRLPGGVTAGPCHPTKPSVPSDP